MKKWLVTIFSPGDAKAVRESDAEILAEYPNALLVLASDELRNALESGGLELTALVDENVRVSGSSFPFTSAIEAEAAAPVTVDPNRTAYYLVKLVGPSKGEWLSTLRGTGAAIQEALPGNTLLVGVQPPRVPEIEAHSWVERVTPYRATMKVSPKLRTDVGQTLNLAQLREMESEPPESSEQVEITVFPGESSEAVAAQVRNGGGTVLSSTPSAVTAVVPRQTIAAIAADQGVQSIVPHRFPTLHNDQAATIMTVPVSHAFGDYTIRGTGQIVGVGDTGLDTGNPAAIHADFAGRVAGIVSLPNVYSALCTDPPPFDDGPQDANVGHGTHVAGSVLGNGAAAMAVGDPTIPAGVAPDARLYFQAIEQMVTWQAAPPAGWPPGQLWPPPAVGLYGLPNDLTDLFDAAYAAGARIHTNSWGSSSAAQRGQYVQNSRTVDQFMFNHRDMLILFSAGNSGGDANANGVIDVDSIGPPGTAKNCLTVGASENLRPNGSMPTPGYDFAWGTGWPVAFPAGPISTDHVSNDSSGMAAFSSRGPTDDGRIKPDVVAPGTNVLSVRSSAFAAAPPILWGDLPAAHPLNGLYCWSGGTSMSTPLVAGAAALVRQHLVQQRGHDVPGSKPSGALIKAFLINGAVSMAGQYPGEIPAGRNSVDGFGRVSVTDTLAPGLLHQTLFADEPDYAVESGQMRTFQVQPIDAAQPLKVTLCWTDAAAPIGNGGVINQLYLRVRQPDGTIVDGDTTPFGTVTNNVQQVVVSAPAPGTYEIRVHGVSVTMHSPGVPVGPNPRQDFALVTSNVMGFSLQPVSIAQAIDTTGSMDFFGFIAPARERANQLADFMRINDKLSITEFSHRAVPPDARTNYALRLLGGYTPDWTAAHTAINAMIADGLTPIGAGLAEAWNQLSTEPATRPRAIVLLSDGFNNFAPDPAAVLPAIPADVPIFSIALGPAANSSTLQDIANSRPNGGYFVVEGDEDVNKLHSIYAAVQALAAGASVIGLSSFTLGAQASQSTEVPVEEGLSEVSFLLSWEGKPVEFQFVITGPDGRTYTAATAATLERRGQTYRLVRIAVPKAGVWKAMVRNPSGSTAYTLSAAAQSPMSILPRITLAGKKLSIVTRLRYSRKPVLKATVSARVTAPKLSQKDAVKKHQARLKELQIPDALAEKGFSQDQILLVKLAVFEAQNFRGTPGGIFGRTDLKAKLVHQGDGVYSASLALPATGNITLNIQCEGNQDGFAWRRTAYLSTRF